MFSLYVTVFIETGDYSLFSFTLLPDNLTVVSLSIFSIAVASEYVGGKIFCDDWTCLDSYSSFMISSTA